MGYERYIWCFSLSENWGLFFDILVIYFTLTGSMGNFAYNLGLSHGYATIIAPIAGSYPTLFVILSYLVFKQKLTRQQLLGVIVSLIGIVALSIFSQ